MPRTREPIIPIYINNFNWLTYVRELAAFFDDVPGAEVIIVDNCSTYPPLLHWYAGACPYKVVRLDQNVGCHAPWHSGAVLPPAVHRATFNSHYYALTDSDLSLDGCPKDVLQLLVSGLEQYADVNKVGLSLEITDLPSDAYVASEVIEWEQGFWQNRRDGRFFDAAIDTTFAVYRVGVPATGGHLRSDRPYTARHQPWYLTPSTVAEEHRYFLEHACGGSWSTRLQQLGCGQPSSSPDPVEA